MVNQTAAKTVAALRRQPHVQYQAGDLVASQGDRYPTLCEVVHVEDEGLLRVRGLNWAPGYSALVAAEAVSPIGRAREDGR